MKITSFAGLAVFSLMTVSGCHKNHDANLVSAVMTPNFHTGTLGIQCLVSSSGTCHFALYGLSTGNTMLDVATGDRKVLTGVNENTLYCAESRKDLLKHCTQILVPREQTIVSRNINSQQPLQLAR